MFCPDLPNGHITERQLEPVLPFEADTFVLNLFYISQQVQYSTLVILCPIFLSRYTCSWKHVLEPVHVELLAISPKESGPRGPLTGFHAFFRLQIPRSQLFQWGPWGVWSTSLHRKRLRRKMTWNQVNLAPYRAVFSRRQWRFYANRCCIQETVKMKSLYVKIARHFL